MSWRDDLAAARAAPIDLHVVERVVATVRPGAVVVGVTPITGGLSSLLDEVRIEAPIPETLVLRRTLPEFGHGRAEAATEVSAHAAATAAGLPVPPVLWWDGGEAFDRPALLMAHVPGRPIVGDLPTPAAAAAFAAAIGAVHAVRPGATTDLPLLTDVAAHRDRFGGVAHDSEVVDAAALHAAVARLAGAFVADDVLVHADLHGGNVLWDGRSVTGILDWPGAGRGVRWHDEAYAVMDTALAHGEPAGERLRAALRDRPDAPSPDADTWALWSGVALLRALPTPAEWVDGYRLMGCRLTEDVLDGRFVAMVERWLGDHGPAHARGG